MNEFTQGFIGTLSLLCPLLFSIAWWLGGRDKNFLGIKARVWRRWIAPLLIGSLLILLSLVKQSFNVWFLLALPAYKLTSHIGYGGDKLWTKILRRTLWSLIISSASLTIGLPTGSYSLIVLQYIIGLCTTLTLGIRNPLSAPQEEGIISFTSVLFVPYMI